MTSHFLTDEGLSVAIPDVFVTLVSSVADVAIATDKAGLIRDVIWNMPRPHGFDPHSLNGLMMQNIVTEESRVKIAQILAGVGTEEGRKRREINHEIDGVGDFPMRYIAVEAGDTVLFLGQEMQAVAALQARLVEAQRALDEDYGRLRQLETRYRVLFQSSSEALLIVNSATRKVQEANAAVARLMGRDASDLTGRTIETLVEPDSRGALIEALDRVVTSGQVETFSARLDHAPVDLDGRLSIFRAADQTMILCALSGGDQRSEGEAAIEQMLMGMIGRIPDAMVLTDQDAQIQWANEAFLSMAEIALAQQAVGQPMARFLGRPGVDMEIIIANAREHGRLRAFASVLTGAFGSETRVEISVAALGDTTPPSIGFVLRDISRYDRVPVRRGESVGEARTDFMDLVGTVPLKELVRASTEEIEKMCIETALKKTGNNRASAAEMLGLSRQSLYVKLRRFGLLESDGR